MKSKYQSPYHFFKQHAGFSCGPEEETNQAKHRCATELAQAERQGKEEGLTFDWDYDADGYSSDFTDNEEDGGMDNDPWQLWRCICRNEDGKILSSLWGVDFGRAGQPWNNPYRRVVEAELAQEALGK